MSIATPTQAQLLGGLLDSLTGGGDGGGLLGVDSGPAGNGNTVNVGVGSGQGNSGNILDVNTGSNRVLGLNAGPATAGWDRR